MECLLICLLVTQKKITERCVDTRVKKYVRNTMDVLCVIVLTTNTKVNKKFYFENTSKNQKRNIFVKIDLFLDLSGLTTYWRDDYRMWRNFYNAYSQSSSSNGDDTCEV